MTHTVARQWDELMDAAALFVEASVQAERGIDPVEPLPVLMFELQQALAALDGVPALGPNSRPISAPALMRGMANVRRMEADRLDDLALEMETEWQQ